MIATEGVDLRFGGSIIRQRNLSCGTESTLLVSGVGKPGGFAN